MIYQMTPALLDALVLSVIEGEDAYGYMIAQQIRSVAAQKESALYPVLKRLEASGYLEAYDQEFQGRNRRYYRITEGGRVQLAYYRQEWQEFKKAADEILVGGMKDGSEGIFKDTGARAAADAESGTPGCP